MLKTFAENNIKTHAVIDSNKNLQGTLIDGIPCISIEDITEDYDIFISVSDPLITEEIKNNLAAANLKNRIITYSDFYEELKNEKVI